MDIATTRPNRQIGKKLKKKRHQCIMATLRQPTSIGVLLLSNQIFP